MAIRQDWQFPERAWRHSLTLILFFSSIGIAVLNFAQTAQQTPSAGITPEALVREVVQNELRVDQSDHSHWMYLDADKYPSKSTRKLVVETDEATVSRTIAVNGRPPDAGERAADRAKMDKVLNDPAVRAKQKKTAEHDDAQGRALTKMVADAFLWKKVGESNGKVTLHFEPNPALQPPTFE